MPESVRTPAYRFTPFSKPGAVSTSASSINDWGQIAGSYTDQSGATHGFVETGGRFASVDVPDAQATSLAGINDFDEVVGNYYDGERWHAFADLNGVVTPIEVPGTTDPSDTTVFALNNRGQIVGEYSDSTGIHGFVDTNGSRSPTSMSPLRYAHCRPASTISG